MRFTLAALLLYALCTLYTPVSAESPDEALALSLARVAAHEGALSNPRDLNLIWQVTRRWGTTSTERLRWLQAHSPRALGLKPSRPGNANAFTAELSKTATIPASVASGASRQKLAYWQHKVMPKWQTLLGRARQLVGGAQYDEPCPIEPVTWGGPMDHEIAAANGRYPIGCEGTLNDGFAPRAMLVAAGRVL
jgi:hypothetical protein